MEMKDGKFRKRLPTFNNLIKASEFDYKLKDVFLRSDLTEIMINDEELIFSAWIIPAIKDKSKLLDANYHSVSGEWSAVIKILFNEEN